MINIQFLTLELYNYRKISHIYLSLANKGIVRVEGKNGAGKSSIFESIVWILFGADSRRSSVSSVIKIGESSVKGTLVVNINDKRYTITRERTATSTTITVVSNTDDKVFTNTKDGQEYLNSLLNITLDTFYQLIFLRQYNISNFFELTDLYQKNFFDIIFDFSAFTDLHEYYDALYKYLNTINTKYENLKSWLTAFLIRLKDENIKLRTLEIPNEEDNIEDKINECKIEADKLKEKIDESTKKLEEEKNKLLTKKDIIENLSNIIKDFKLKEKFFPEKVDLYKESLDSDKCIVCERALNQKLITKFTTTLNELEDLKNDLATMELNRFKENEEYSNILSTIRVLESDIKTFEIRQNNYTNKIKYIIEGNNTAKTKKEQIDSIINSRNDIIEKNNKKIQSIEKILNNTNWKALTELLESIKNIKDLFGKQGLKNNFLDIYLVALQTKINFILEELLPNTKLTISTVKETSTGDFRRHLNIKITKDSNELSYFDLSGGERKRLDMSFILAVHALLEELGSFSSNILILDEAFDGLDADGMEEFSNYIRGYEKSSIFLITHTPYTTYADNLISVE